MGKAKLLKNIKGYDDVGIGLIDCGEGGGTYILCRDLEAYDLTGIQIYSYHTFTKRMRKADKTDKDTQNIIYFVKREDLVR